MVPRRPDQSEGLAAFPIHHQTPGGNGSPGADLMRQSINFVDSGRAHMHPPDVLLFGQFRAIFDDAGQVEQPFLPQLVLGIEQTLFPLRMVGADGPVVGRKKNYA